MADSDDLDEVLEDYATMPQADRGAVARARAIRDRERRLAELARETYDWPVIQNDLSPIDRDWLRRYEEAVK